MMGVTLFTVNVRLSPAQILYTLADSDARVLLVHTDFLPVIEQIRAQLPLLRHIVLHAMATALSVCSPGGAQRLSTADVYVPITPMFHVLGWGFPYITIMLGLRTVLPGRYLPDVLLMLRETEKVTFSHCVPTILQMLLSGAEKTGQDLSGWMSAKSPRPVSARSTGSNCAQHRRAWS